MKSFISPSALALASLLSSSVPHVIFSQETPAALVESAAPAPSPGASSPVLAGDGEEAEPSPQQKAAMAAYENMGWQKEGTGKIGPYAEIRIEPGFRFLPKEHTAEWLRFTGNLADSSILGVYESLDSSWTAVYQYEDSGHVKDDEKDKLDADKLLKTRKEQNILGNEERKRQGLSPMTLIDWSMKPTYNDQTKNLEWGLRFQVEGHETINHTTKLLSREGIMDVVLICSPEDLGQVMPKYQSSLAGFSFVEGHKYAEYKKGDKLAEYGLTALAAGTGVAVLAKTGLLAKFFGLFAKMGKGIIAVIAGVFIGIGKLLGFVKNKRAANQE